MALLGLIALAGVIMRNGVLLVDQIEIDREWGRHTLRKASVRRLWIDISRKIADTFGMAILPSQHVCSNYKQ